jgi:2-keto-3-deoxy-galactonokinase
LLDVQTRIRLALPPWAAGAEISVTEDAAHERVVEVSLPLPISSLLALDVRQIAHVLRLKQIEFSYRGALIGRTIVTVRDAASGDPLYVAGDDVLYGRLSQWFSPLAAAYAGGLRDDTSPADTSRDVPVGGL